MASIPCAAYKAGHIHDRLRKKHQHELRVRAATLPEVDMPARTTVEVVKAEEIGRRLFDFQQGLIGQVWRSLSDKGRVHLGGSNPTLASPPVPEPPPMQSQPLVKAS